MADAISTNQGLYQKHEAQFDLARRGVYGVFSMVSIVFMALILSGDTPVYTLKFQAEFAGSPQAIVIERALKAYAYDADNGDNSLVAVPDLNSYSQYSGTDMNTHSLTDMKGDGKVEIDCSNPGHVTSPFIYPVASTDCSAAHACNACRALTAAGRTPCETHNCSWTDGDVCTATDTACQYPASCLPCRAASTEHHCTAERPSGHVCVWDGDTCADGVITDSDDYCGDQIDIITAFAGVMIAFSGLLLVLVLVQHYFRNSKIAAVSRWATVLMLATQLVHLVAVVVGSMYMMTKDNGNDSYFAINIAAMGNPISGTDNPDKSDALGNAMLEFEFWGLIAVTGMHAVHVGLVACTTDFDGLEFRGYHKLYANFM